MNGDEERFALRTGKLSLADLEGHAGDLRWQVGRFEVADVGFAGAGGNLKQATLSDVRLAMSGLEVAIEHIACPRGLVASKTGVSAPRLELGGITVTSPGILRIGKGEAGESDEAGAGEAAAGKSEPAPETASKSPAKRPDLRFLDALFGHLHLDLFLHMSVPVIGERRGTHQFRVSLNEGAISYQKVESDLAWLEDAFVDIEVSKDRLVIMQKIPLVPIPGTRLISWRLDPDELALARERGLVKLSKLVDFELPQKRPEEVKPGKKPKVAFHQIALQNIDIGADAAGPVQCAFGERARFELGDGEGGGIAGLAITGEIVHRFGTLSPETEVGCRWSAVTARQGSFGIGKTHVAVGTALVGETRATLAFTGFRPGALAAAVETIAIDDLKIDL